MLSTGNAQLFGNGVNVSDTLEHDVARAIAQFEVSLFGSEDEKLVSHFMSLVDHTKIGRILERVSAGSSPDEAVRLYAPFFLVVSGLEHSKVKTIHQMHHLHKLLRHLNRLYRPSRRGTLSYWNRPALSG